MFAKLIGLAVILSVLVSHVNGRPQQDAPSVEATTETDTWDKIKKGVERGWQVVYDESHCALHKVKELVKHHDHEEGSDPCENKPYQQKSNGTEKTIVLVAEERVPVTTTPKL